MSAQPHKVEDEALSVLRAVELKAQEPAQQWLISGLWAKAGVGLIGGPPKCCKSWLGLEMAVSLASATPCLGAFAPGSKGRVLLYMAEDAPYVVRTRFDSLCHHHGVALSSLDIFVITESNLRIDLPSQQQRLLKTVQKIRPDMLLLDPLVRLHRIDENSASEVSALLGFLRALQREFHTAVVLVHHARKNGSANQPGQALRGSSDLHAFGDSNLYLKRHRQQLVLTIEHRAAPSPDPFELRLLGGDRPHLELAARSGPKTGELSEAVHEILRLKGPMTRAGLRQQLRIRNERLGKALSCLQDKGSIQRTASGWQLTTHVEQAPAAEHVEQAPAAEQPHGQLVVPFPPNRSGQERNGDRGR